MKPSSPDAMSLFPSQSSHHQIIHDVAEYCVMMQEAWDLNFDQLTAGTINIENKGRSLGNAFIYLENYDREVRIHGSLRKGLLAFSLPSSESRMAKWWGDELPKDSLAFTTSFREVELSLNNSYSNTLILISESDFRKSYADLSGEDPDFLDAGPPYLQMTPQGIRELNQNLKQILTNPGPPQCPGNFVQVFVEAILRGRLKNPDLITSSPRHYRKVREAIDLWESERFSLSVLDVSQRLGMSKRALEQSFTKKLGYSPYQFMKKNRLNEVRRSLLGADPNHDTVTDIAMKFEFYELGRFAVEYRKFFDETPLSTLKRFQSHPAFFV